MKVKISNTPNKDTIQLQYMGHVYGTLATELKSGDHTIWNSGGVEKIEGIEKETKAFITFKISYIDYDNKTVFSTRRLKKTRIVGRPLNELPEHLKNK